MEMDEPRTKDELLTRIRDGRSEFDTVLLAVPPESVNEPVFAGGWSVKDLVAHIASYERWTAAQIAAANEGRAPTDRELSGVEELPEDPEGWDLDRQNAARQAQYAGLTYPEALAFAEESFNQLLRVLITTPDAAVTQPGTQGWLAGKTILEAVPIQTYQHYADHLPQLWDLAGKPTI